MLHSTNGNYGVIPFISLFVLRHVPVLRFPVGDRFLRTETQQWHIFVWLSLWTSLFKETRGEFCPNLL